MKDKKYLLPWLVSFGIFMENLDSTVINTAIPQMADSFAVNPLLLKLAITSYLVSLVLFMPISGYLADKLGTKRIFISAIIIFILGSLLCSLSPNLVMLVIARILQGLGGAMMVPTGRLILIKNFEKSAMVNALSNMAIIGQLGPAFGPIFGGALTSYLSWHWVFFINLPIGAAGVFFAQRWINHNHKENTPPFDIIGFLLFGLGLRKCRYLGRYFAHPSCKIASQNATTIKLRPPSSHGVTCLNSAHFTPCSQLALRPV